MFRSGDLYQLVTTMWLTHLLFGHTDQHHSRSSTTISTSRHSIHNWGGVRRENPISWNKLFYVPYVKEGSEKIECVCTPWVSRQCSNQEIPSDNPWCGWRTQDPMTQREGWSSYQVPCGDSDHVYVGETGQCLQKRVNEHRYAVKTGNMKNGIAAHAWKNQHRVDWESARIEQRYWKWRVLEAIHIWRQKNPSNLDCGLHLNSTWPLIQATNRFIPHLIHPSAFSVFWQLY